MLRSKSLPRKLNVLIIDDAFTSRQIIRRLVEEIPSAACHEFGDPGDALRWCAETDPDLIIVDYQMPGINGLDFVDRVRALPGKRCPIVFVTCDPNKSLRHAVLKRGAADFLVKPVDPDEFVARIHNLLELRVDRLRLKTRLARHAHRMEALWRIAVRSDLAGDELVYEMLEEAAIALRPSEPFFGAICELVGDDIVVRYKGVKALLRAGHDPEDDPYPVGARVPGSEALSFALPADGHAMGWTDLAGDSATRSLPHYRLGARAAIGARFFVERRTFSIVFYSYEEIAQTFDRNDYTYVELIASFLAAKLREIEHAEVIRFQAYHDPLTGLMNRNGLRSHLREAVGAHNTSGHSLAVAVVDIDQFKEINDTMGNETGDFALKAVARRLVESIRPGDTLARLDGNSFAISFKNLESVEQAEDLTRRSIVSIGAPIAVGEAVIRLTASAGIALFPNDAVDPDDLITRADAALDLAKHDGRDRIQFSSPQIEEGLRKRQALRQSILRGLGSEEFELYLQPEVDLATGIPVAAEALIRWNHPDLQLSPADFIPFAEQSGLIQPLSLYIMRHAMHAANELARIRPGLRLFFNLSAHDFANPLFFEELTRALKEYAVDPNSLGVELTETSAVTDVERTIAVLDRVHDLGLAVALDDFGTGYSSLAILKRLPIDVIKIDRSFIAGLPHDPKDVAIARNLINIGHDLGRTVLVEGVETEEQLRWLCRHGCDRAQGYRLGTPMPLEAMLAWLGPDAA